MRIGVAPALRASVAKVARLVVYCERETLEVDFWSLWPNWGGCQLVMLGWEVDTIR